MSYYQLATRNGYAMHEVMSALQKDIRRCNERDAIFWALEMAPNFESALWHRLVVISHEDIGLANPMVFTAIPTMRDEYMRLRTKSNSGCWLVLVNAVMLLCRSPKSRLADDAFATAQGEAHNGVYRPEIPDYALDGHTQRGKRMGRGDEFFYEHCVLSAYPDGFPAGFNPYEQSAKIQWATNFDQIPQSKVAKVNQMELYEASDE